MTPSTLLGVWMVATAPSAALAAPVITNGDLNGTVGAFTAPDGWVVAQATPDLADANGPYNNTGQPWTLSPNGGTFARMNGVRDNRSERISQVVSGFDVGETYRLDMYVCNLGDYSTANIWRGEDGYVQLFDGNSLLGVSQTLTKPAAETDPIVWEEASFEFVATSASMNLKIGSETLGSIGNVAFLGVDGVSISLVPATGGLALLAVSGVIACRRRR